MAARSPRGLGRPCGGRKHPMIEPRTYRTEGRPPLQQINRAHSPLLAIAMPWLCIMAGSFLPMLLLVAGAPIMPPSGFMLLLAWRLIRPGLLPAWAGVPLGLFDDLFSGQPFGCAIMLWPIALLAIDALEVRFPWRDFWQDWFAASLLMATYLLLCTLFSGAGGVFGRSVLIVPQLVLAILLFPVAGRIVAIADRLRLLRIRRID